VRRFAVMTTALARISLRPLPTAASSTRRRRWPSLRRLSARATALAAAATLLLGSREAGALAEQPAAAASAAVEKVDTTYQSVDATISAQWEFPARTPAPLVVLLPASDSVDRDGLPPGFGADPSTGIYAQLARKLLEAGFAVFRFDPAGSGRSSAGQYTTSRATAIEGYTRAVDHPKVDRSRVFLIGHSASTDTVVGIYPRYAAVVPPAGVVLLANIVGETDLVRVDAPTLIVVTDRTPDDLYQRGQFPVDARSRVTDRKLETSLVTLPGAEDTLLSPIDKTGGGKLYSLDPRAVDAAIEWMRGRLGLPQKS
jgi:pimeloyl-ACP methyl ester carboxylesterase